jgi:hypothetical protein
MTNSADVLGRDFADGIPDGGVSLRERRDAKPAPETEVDNGPGSVLISRIAGAMVRINKVADLADQLPPAYRAAGFG